MLTWHLSDTWYAKLLQKQQMPNDYSASSLPTGFSFIPTGCPNGIFLPWCCDIASSTGRFWGWRQSSLMFGKVCVSWFLMIWSGDNVPILQLSTWLTYISFGTQRTHLIAVLVWKKVTVTTSTCCLGNLSSLVVSRLPLGFKAPYKQVPFSNPLFNTVSQVFSSLSSDCNYRVFIYHLTGN